MQTGTPRKRDYIQWMIIPALVGMVTFGIGTIVLMIVWAADNNNMARANYFRALFIMALSSMGIGITFLLLMSIMFTQMLK